MQIMPWGSPLPTAAAIAVAAVVFVSGCAQMVPPPRPSSEGHIGNDEPPNARAAAIPEPVRRTPFVPVPVPAPPSETYTVVVNEVPVKELLFALARDASINVDIHPDVEGQVTLNAVDQTLDQILDRISRQSDVRYEFRKQSLVIMPDTPYLRTYRVDYVNVSRDATSTSSVATQISTTGATDIAGGDGGGGSGGGGGGDNNSTTSVDSVSNHRFWQTTTDTIRNMLAGENRTSEFDEEDEESGFNPEEDVIPNPETGVMVVRATERQHEMVQAYLDRTMASSRRQVLIEATIVEVELADGYQAGIDWAKLVENAGVAAAQILTSNLTGIPTFVLEYSNERDDDGFLTGDIRFTVTLLKDFGETKVLSSPKIMALNNQTALLKVVENTVYFEVEQDISGGNVNTNPVTATTTTARTVPVGVVMSVTPQISGADEVIINVRPTISRIVDFTPDPNPALTIPNLVPEIAVREFESVLRVSSGQIAVLGGLMQDAIDVDLNEVPVLSDIENVGELFRSRNQTFVKTELVIFMRPWVIRTPDVQADLSNFRRYLPAESYPLNQPITTPIGDQINAELFRGWGAMSLLMDALKRAERAREAQSETAGDVDPGETQGFTLDPIEPSDDPAAIPAARAAARGLALECLPGRLRARRRDARTQRAGRRSGHGSRRAGSPRLDRAAPLSEPARRSVPAGGTRRRPCPR